MLAYPGGGGYGDPRKRDPHAVAADVADGLLSAARAREVYGAAWERHLAELAGPRPERPR
jgi:N-methylhydantoinase B